MYTHGDMGKHVQLAGSAWPSSPLGWRTAASILKDDLTQRVQISRDYPEALSTRIFGGLGTKGHITLGVGAVLSLKKVKDLGLNDYVHCPAAWCNCFEVCCFTLKAPA